MKTTKLLVLGAVVAAFSFTSFAAESLRSPRAQDNQIKTVRTSGATQTTTVAYASPASALLSPRAQANQTKIVAGVVSDRNPGQDCRSTMVGSPKAVAECGSHTTMPGCAKLTAMK